MAQSRTLFLRVGNIVAFIITLVVNGLAGVGLLNGRTTAQVSNLYSSLVTPAGYVFAIWGIIYALLFIFIIYQALSSKKGKPFQKQVSELFILSSLFNCIWIFLWQYNFISLSVVAIVALLATLIAIYLCLGVGTAQVSLREMLFVHLPFSVYFGWITIAALADIAAALVYGRWNGLSPIIWAVAMLVVALVVTLIIIVFRRDIAYSLVIVWALVGIAANHDANQTVVYVVEVAIVVILIALALSIAMNRTRHKTMREK